MSVMAMIGTLGAGALASASQMQTNRANIEAQMKTNAWQADLADSAHQREVLDLYRAGLNPILSASGSGASVPSLGTPTLQSPGQGIADGISSAANLMSSQYKANVKALNAQAKKTNADTSAVRVHRDLVRTQQVNEAIKGDILAYEKATSVNSNYNSMLKEMALSEALTGRRHEELYNNINWEDEKAVKAYFDLVQSYRNTIERERYMNSVERQLILDGVGSAKSLNTVKGAIKRVKRR